MTPLRPFASAVLVSLCALPAGVASAGTTDLGALYKATLDRDEKNVVSYDTDCGEGDVWDLTSFTYEVPHRFKIAFGPSTVTFGRHGTSVLWSVIVPKEPGQMKSEEGGDEKVTSVWFRFHPSLVGDLFPAKTVAGPGDPKAVYWAKRVYWWRIDDWCQAESGPCIPGKSWQVVSADTASGGARFYIVDAKAKTAKAFNGRQAGAVPALPRPPIGEGDAVKAFDGAWAEFDTTYAKFGLRKDVDWDELKKRLRPVAASSATAYEAAGAIALLVTPLRDLHVRVTVGDEGVPCYFRPRLFSGGNQKAAGALLGTTVTDTGQSIAWARSKDGVGYVQVQGLENHDAVAAFDKALDSVATTWGLVVDLRTNGGGDEPTACEMAGRIMDKERTYAVDCFRNGTRRDQLGPNLERRCAPRGPWRYGGPVVVLIGQQTMSSAESFALMLAACPNVTTMGDRTCGSSGAPKRVELPGGIAVNVPTWNDMTPDGVPIEDRGVQPKVPVVVPEGAFDETHDPVLEAALARLRKTPESARHPARPK